MGSRTEAQRLEENIGAARAELTLDDLRDDAHLTVHGARNPANLERMTGR
jgi:hypothetical protein